MRKISEQVLDLLEQGYDPFEIADMLRIRVQDVDDIMATAWPEDEYQDDYDDYNDGDDASALASAGFGTDEDYGYYGDGE